MFKYIFFIFLIFPSCSVFAEMSCAKLNFVGADKCEDSFVSIDTSNCPGGSKYPKDIKIRCEGFKAHGLLKFKNKKYKVELIGHQGMWGMNWKLISPELIKVKKRTPSSFNSSKQLTPKVFHSKIYIYY